jgi:hypothetical protein
MVSRVHPIPETQAAGSQSIRFEVRVPASPSDECKRNPGFELAGILAGEIALANSPG